VAGLGHQEAYRLASLSPTIPGSVSLIAKQLNPQRRFVAVELSVNAAFMTGVGAPPGRERDESHQEETSLTLPETLYSLRSLLAFGLS
jgi:hypothetical protein